MKCFLTATNLHSHSESASEHLSNSDRKPQRDKHPSPPEAKPSGRDVCTQMRCLHIKVDAEEAKSWALARVYLGKKKTLELCQGLDFKQDKEFGGRKEKVSKEIF